MSNIRRKARLHGRRAKNLKPQQTASGANSEPGGTLNEEFLTSCVKLQETGASSGLTKRNTCIYSFCACHTMGIATAGLSNMSVERMCRLRVTLPLKKVLRCHPPPARLFVFANPISHPFLTKSSHAKPSPRALPPHSPWPVPTTPTLTGRLSSK